MQVDKIIYNAIQADADLMTTIGSRVVSTCYEVPPTEEDNTPLPFIIVTDDGFQNQQTTKDCVWEAAEDRVHVGVEVAAASPNEVKDIIKQVRKAVEQYVATMYQQGEEIPQLDSLSSDGLAWDWMKPCYYQRLTYQVTTLSNIDDGQEI
jgi:hypothetical protein